MNSDVWPLPNCREYSANAFNDSIPSGASDEPVIGSFISSSESKPRVVTPPVNKIIIRNPLIGILLIPPHTLGLVRLLNLVSHDNVGTKIIEKINVETIPITNVSPTERIGVIGTIEGAINTEKPIIVVIAERKTATPVEDVISKIHSL